MDDESPFLLILKHHHPPFPFTAQIDTMIAQRLPSLVFLAISCILFAQGALAAGKVQSTQAKADVNRAQAVKDAFRKSFDDYLTYARGADELLPLKKAPSGGFGNWGATFIDALTTAHLMGFDDIVTQGITFATEKVNFANTSQSEISLFETNIRYVASLTSLYELTGRQNEKLISQAQVVADKLLDGWVGENDIPFNGLQQWNAGPVPDTKDQRAIIAEAGTLLLEFDRLSKYSNNDTYRSYAERSMKAVINSNSVLPGLYGQGINPQTAQRTDDYVTWGGGSDSFFEYLIKYGQLIGSSDTYIETWIDSVTSSIQYLLTKPGDTQAKFTRMSDYSPSNGGKIPQFSHLGCFVGGNWILGGKLLGNEQVAQYGLDLADGCIQTYTAGATGIGPEVFVFKSEDGSTNGVSINNETSYQQNGFGYSVSSYALRPEVLESVFYAYRATGDQRWQDLAWSAFNNIIKYCSSNAALASIETVTSTSTRQLDSSQSFLYAELFKYLFLTFDDPDHISLDQYVFNTEGHPYKVDNVDADYSNAQFGSLPTPFQTSSTPTSSKQRNIPKPLITGVGKVRGLLGDLADLL